MARHLPLLPMQKLHFLPTPVTFFIVLTVVFSVFTVVTFLCGSRGEEKRTVRLGGKSMGAVKKVDGGVFNKLLLMAKMISWRKVEAGGGEMEFDEDGGAVWKKTIIRGEKCRPLDFSGRILYDSKGNILLE